MQKSWHRLATIAHGGRAVFVILAMDTASLNREFDVLKIADPVDLEKMLKEMGSHLKALSDEFINLTVTPTTTLAIAAALRRVLAPLVAEDASYLDLEVKKSGSPGDIIINPNNLFTALALKGIFVPYETVFGKSFYTVPDGVPYFGGGTFSFLHTGCDDKPGYYFTPAHPVEYISITFSSK